MHYVDSYAHPGRNITGFTPFEPSLGAKWLSILKEIAPEIEHIGLIYNPEPGNNARAFREPSTRSPLSSRSRRSKILQATEPTSSA